MPQRDQRGQVYQEAMNYGQAMFEQAVASLGDDAQHWAEMKDEAYSSLELLKELLNELDGVTISEELEVRVMAAIERSARTGVQTGLDFDSREEAVAVRRWLDQGGAFSRVGWDESGSLIWVWGVQVDMDMVGACDRELDLDRDVLIRSVRPWKVALGRHHN